MRTGDNYNRAVADLADEFLVTVTLPGTAERFIRPCSGQVTLGRGDDTDIQLAHPAVSRRHAQVSLDADGAFLIRDLGSRNGTTVNDDQHVQNSEIKSAGNVTLQVGPYMLLLSLPGEQYADTLDFDAKRTRRRAILNNGTHTLEVDGRAVIEGLAGLEYSLLATLSGAAPDLVPNASLGDAVWGKGQWDSYLLYNLVRRVRRKIEEAGLDGDEIIVTAAGVGYRLA